MPLGPRAEHAPDPGAKRAPISPTGGACELEAKIAEEYRAVCLLRASIAGEASARGERVREWGKQARECINVDNPPTPRAGPRDSPRSS
jgi:hypothetical protein